ncbi:MAG: WxcM-like domain-containing protein [Mongoliibacter sp.]|uniref:sugar 3,4-ketoisomerase n=1 Tax=Mongoliibacter sp. TaxID=2022438 RepID=UPI0012F3EA6F|nr:FdtA/QdtA family cupin domain-containing protein [Mongoliibacter sp.]TVP53009.1 MAG: WxcM-like domain-containing protein [Mongoliibacter sp.]
MNTSDTKPCIVTLEHKPGEKGNITFFESEQLKTFLPKRFFWLSNIPEGSFRGIHAHKLENQVLICLKGEVKISLESISGENFEFNLEKESQGLLVPSMHWQKIEFGKDAILLVMADREFSEEDYIRDKNIFDELRNQH